MADVIQTLQFKRGLKTNLETLLVGDNKPKKGEPVYETDTGKLKIGDGTNNYADLAYLSGDDSRFVIQDPLSNQILMYDSTTGKWVNKILADENSIIYIDNSGLTLKGYSNASQGQMLVKDQTSGLAWIDPLSTTVLDQKVELARQHAATAGSYATQAGSYAASASSSATTAATINEQTIEYVENKFWWGTLEEYNALEQIDEGTFYYIKPAN